MHLKREVKNNLPFFIFIFLFIIYSINILTAANTSNYQITNLTQTVQINSTNKSSVLSNTTFLIQRKEVIDIINKVNNSAYLIFYPNLSSAYKFISHANNQTLKNLSNALLLLNDAKLAAIQQQQHIDSYKGIAFIIMLILTIICLFILYLIISPKYFTENKKNKN
ncbi:MAG: hypothetical protein ACP5RI_00530 [Candidatus Micrarchaeia archaeon]